MRQINNSIRRSLSIFIFVVFLLSIFTSNAISAMDDTFDPAPAPVITIITQPEDCEVSIQDGVLIKGGRLEIKAEVEPAGELVYRWYQRLVETPDPLVGEFLGYGDSLDLPTPSTPIAYSSINYYYCEVSAEGAESVISDVVEVYVGVAISDPGVEIVTHPAKLTTVTEGFITEELFVEAKPIGNITPNYRWARNTEPSNKNGEPIFGENSPVFKIPADLSAEGSPYYFYCEVSGGIDHLASDLATVIVYKPTIVVLDNIAVTSLPSGTASYAVGDKLNLAGMVVVAYYSDGNMTDITAFATSDPASGAILGEPGNQIVTISYTEGGVTKTARFNITVNGVITTPPPHYSISSDAAELIFPAVKEGYGKQTPQSVNISNTGSEPTGVMSVSLTGDVKAFTLSHNEIDSVAVGGNAVLTVEPAVGLAAGAYNAVVEIIGVDMISASLSLRFIVNVDDSGSSGGDGDDKNKDDDKDNDKDKDKDKEDDSDKNSNGGSTGGGSTGTGGGNAPSGAVAPTPAPTPQSDQQQHSDSSQVDPIEATDIPYDDTYLGGAAPTLINLFEDVYDDDWYRDDIAYVYANGLMLGMYTEPMLFNPQMNLDRSMIVTILYRMEGSPGVSGIPTDLATPEQPTSTAGLATPEPTTGTPAPDLAAPAPVSTALANPFTDVPAGTWYTDPVIWAAANGIVGGYGDGRFGPEDPITREQLATILCRYADYVGFDLPVLRDYPGFADGVLIDNYAIDAVERLYMAEIVGGKLLNTFDPKGNATRAETAAILHRFTALIENN